MDWYSSLFNMIAIDVLVGAICTLVFVLNELWSDKSKTRLVYHQMPSDAVFSDIASGKIDATGFDLETAQKMYGHMADAPANLQTAEWNKLLQKSRISEMGNVIEAERLQLMTRDIWKIPDPAFPVAVAPQPCLCTGRLGNIRVLQKSGCGGSQ